MRFIVPLCVLLVSASIAHADGAARAGQGKKILAIPIEAAEPLSALPRVPVRRENLVDDKLAELLRATDPANRESVKAAALQICGAATMAMADCLDTLVRANAFLAHEHPVMEAAQTPPENP